MNICAISVSSLASRSVGQSFSRQWTVNSKQWEQMIKANSNKIAVQVKSFCPTFFKKRAAGGKK